MAIHRTVLRTVDRRWRIESDADGTRLRVFHDDELKADVNNVAALERTLAEFGIDIASLISD